MGQSETKATSISRNWEASVTFRLYFDCIWTSTECTLSHDFDYFYYTWNETTLLRLTTHWHITLQWFHWIASHRIILDFHLMSNTNDYLMCVPMRAFSVYSIHICVKHMCLISISIQKKCAQWNVVLLFTRFVCLIHIHRLSFHSQMEMDNFNISSRKCLYGNLLLAQLLLCIKRIIIDCVFVVWWKMQTKSLHLSNF